MNDKSKGSNNVENMEPMARHSSRLRMMLIEDDAAIAGMISKAVAESPLVRGEVVHVREIEEAVNRLAEEVVDLILLDVSPAGDSDIDLIARLHAVAPGVPIVVLSEEEHQLGRVRAIREGVQEYLLKSDLDGHSLARVIRHAIERQEAEARYRDLYDRAPDGYFTVNAEGVVTEMNATLLEWLGCRREGILGEMRFAELVAPEHRRRLSAREEQCRERGEAGSVELELVCSDGHRIPVRLNMVGVRDRQGAYQGYWATARDISAEKKLEAQLLQAQKLESLGTLVGGIAHDFNNMLTAILGYTQLLLREASQGDRFYEHLQQIEVLSQRAADVVQQLLTFSREGTSRQRRLLLHPLLKEIGKLLQRMIPENIEVEMHLAAEDLAVEADPTQLQQVVMNLVVNARDAMPEGGRLRIETARVNLDESFCRAHPDLRPGDYVRLRVSDTGVGIPPDIQRRIFDPFFTTKEAGKGTGLGLPVVYGIVKNHGGAVEVDSEVGRGTTIALYFPLVEKPAQVERAPSVDVKGGSETILLVEDEPTVLELARAALEHYGYQVLTAQNGLEAIATYRDHQSEIALVILDVVMPKLGGRETFRELRRIDPGVKAILASGYDTSQSLVRELLQSGVCGLVRKPYQIRELAQAVRRALDQSRMENREGASTKNKVPHPPHPFFGLI